MAVAIKKACDSSLDSWDDEFLSNPPKTEMLNKDSVSLGSVLLNGLG